MQSSLATNINFNLSNDRKPAKLIFPPDFHNDKEIDDTKTPIHVKVQKADRFFSDPG